MAEYPIIIRYENYGNPPPLPAGALRVFKARENGPTIGYDFWAIVYPGIQYTGAVKGLYYFQPSGSALSSTPDYTNQQAFINNGKVWIPAQHTSWSDLELLQINAGLQPGIIPGTPQVLYQTHAFTSAQETISAQEQLITPGSTASTSGLASALTPTQTAAIQQTYNDVFASPTAAVYNVTATPAPVVSFSDLQTQAAAQATAAFATIFPDTSVTPNTPVSDTSFSGVLGDIFNTAQSTVQSAMDAFNSSPLAILTPIGAANAVIGAADAFLPSPATIVQDAGTIAAISPIGMFQSALTNIAAPAAQAENTAFQNIGDALTATEQAVSTTAKDITAAVNAAPEAAVAASTGLSLAALAAVGFVAYEIFK